MRLVSILVAVALSLPACTINFNSPAPPADTPAASGPAGGAVAPPNDDDSAAGAAVLRRGLALLRRRDAVGGVGR